jgi:beta propeller repeat protein
MYLNQKVTQNNASNLGRLVSLIGVLLTIIVLVACGGGSDGDSAGDGSALEEFPMDAEGGVIEYIMPDNPDIEVRLTVPEDAVPDGTVITVEPADSYPENKNIIPGLVFDFGPDGLVFNTPSQLVITYDSDNLNGVPEAFLAIYKMTNDTWEQLESTVDTVNKTVTAMIAGFSLGGLGEESTPPLTSASPGWGHYQDPIRVTLTCADLGSGCATIYYAIDDDVPIDSFTEYTGLIPINTATHLRYFSEDNAGNRETPPKIANYTIESGQEWDKPVSTATPPGGNYNEPMSVVLSCDDGEDGSGCANIYYTTDGTAPNIGSDVYTDPIVITDTTILTFFSEDNSLNLESAHAETYLFGADQDTDPPTTIAIPEGGTYDSYQTITLNRGDGNGAGVAGTYYTVDGSNPTMDSYQYSIPLQIQVDTVLKFFSVDKIGNQEAIQTEEYFIEIPPPDTYTVTVNVSGLRGTLGLRLQYVDSATQTDIFPDPVSISSDGPYTFPTSIPDGDTWEVRVEEDPATQKCVLANNSGQINGANVTNVNATFTDGASPTTTADPSGGEFNSAQSVTLACVDDEYGAGCDATYYTTDGNLPTTSSMSYNGAIQIAETTTLRFFSVDNAGNTEAPRTEVYTIGTTDPTKIAVFEDHDLADFLKGKGLAVDDVYGSPSATAPKTSGDLIVWNDNRSGLSELYAYQISEDQEFKFDAEYPGPCDIGGDYVVWRNTGHIYAYQISTEGEPFQVTTGSSISGNPRTDGNHIVWYDDAGGNYDIYACQISSEGECDPFQVTADSNNQADPQVSGDYIVWQDRRDDAVNGDVYGYKISTQQEFVVAQGSGHETFTISGDYVLWRRYGSDNLYAYELSNGRTFLIGPSQGDFGIDTRFDNYVVWVNSGQVHLAILYENEVESSTVVGETNSYLLQISGRNIVWAYKDDPSSIDVTFYCSKIGENGILGDPFVVTTASLLGGIHVSDTHIVWGDARDRPNGTDIYACDLSGGEAFKVSRMDNMTHLDLIEHISDYYMIVFGEGGTWALELFDAADAAGVKALALGGDGLGQSVGYRYGIEVGYGSYDGRQQEIDVTANGLGHAIFDGLDTSGTIYLDDGSIAGDIEYSFTSSGDDRPADWTELAVWGASMGVPGEAVIIEFTTPNGTSVILNAGGTRKDIWTQDAWDILYNEVLYLME